MQLTLRNIYTWSAADCRKCLGMRTGECNKGDFGYIALIAGSMRYGGAAKLANWAACAVKSGAGVVKLAVPNAIAQSMLPYLLESTLFPLSDKDGELAFVQKEVAELVRNVRCVAIGMGCGTGKGVRETLQFLLKEFDGVLVVDADGLNCLAKMGVSALKNCRPKVVLTPHIKEFARLTGLSVEEIAARPAECALQFAQKYGVTVLLKGAETFVADECRAVLVNRGCAGMATAGSGDVLSGIVAALCAFNPDRPTEAAATAAYINGRAGELAQSEADAISMTASDTAKHIARAIGMIVRSPYPSDEEADGLLHAAVALFNAREGHLLRNDLSGRCMCARLAYHLQSLLDQSPFCDYVADVEYNRGEKGVDRAHKSLHDKLITVDLVVHKRGFDEQFGYSNLLCVEMKKSRNMRLAEQDMRRLQDLTSSDFGFCYRYGYLVVADLARQKLVVQARFEHGQRTI